MNLEEFETRYRNIIDRSLNQLQTTVLLLAQVEVSVASISQDIQSLSQLVEEYIRDQRAE